MGGKDENAKTIGKVNTKCHMFNCVVTVTRKIHILHSLHRNVAMVQIFLRMQLYRPQPQLQFVTFSTTEGKGDEVA